jgi:hypothetical protein
MRLLIASVAALVAVAFAAPSFAQDETPAAAPVPTAKPKPGTSAYCQTLKSSSSRSACLKKVSASTKAAPAATKTAKAKTKKPTTSPTTAPKQPDSAQLAPPAAPTSAPAPAGSVAVPPLPSKTI